VRGKNRTGQTRPYAARAKWGISIVALLVLTAIGAGSSSAMRFVNSSPRHFSATPVITAKQHEGQKSDLSYSSGNITQYKESDTINFRFTLTGSEASAGQVQVRFTENDGDCLFFSNYFVLGATTNISGATPTVGVASGPTASAGEWVVTLNVSFSGEGAGVVNYQLKLSNEAGDCNGSSQHSRLTPGDGVSQTGQQNVPVPANQIIELPSITVAKQVDRADGAGFVAATAGEYCFTLDSGACTPTDSSGQVVFTSVTDGAHTITESANLAHPGYTFDSGVGTNCTFAGGTATATVAQGTTATNATCTFKNKQTAPPNVTVTKSCPNGAANSSDRFQVRLNGVDAGTALACGGSLDVNPAAGQAYSITENAAGATDFANYTSSLSSGCSGTLTFGGTATCTITNTRKAAPKVTVTKSCPEGAASSGDRFQVKLDGGNSGDALACGGSVDVAVTAGQAYAITEAAAGTTNLTNYTSASSVGCSGTLAHFGDSASCTITNTLKAAPKVTVTKSCPGGKANDGDRFQVKRDGSNVGTALDCGGTTDVTVAAGQAYAITEGAAGTTDLANYTTASSSGCSGTLANFGDSAICTLTNTLKAAPKVTVTKSCPGGKANDGDRFQVKLDGSNAGTALDCSGSRDVTVTAGQAYAITEGAAGTSDLADYTTALSAGCSGTLTHFGDTASCTITNTLKAAPKVTVTKSCPNGKAHDGDRFQIKQGAANVGNPLDCGGSVDVSVTAGQAYSMTESAAGTADLDDYTTTSSAGCSGTLANFGGTATCTITNTLKAAPKVTVTKACPGGKAAAGDRFQVKRDGSNVGTALDCGDATDVTVTAGQAYAITEGAAGTTDLANYTTTSSAGCSGTLANFGDTASCTITNTLRAAPKVTVTKSCPNGAAGTGDRFQVRLDGQDAGDPLACAGSRDVSVTVGKPYAITEGAAGTTDLANYTSSLSDDCSGTLANFGDTATCTITNTLKAAPKVTVTKACPNGKANTGDRFQVERNGTDVGTALDCGAESNDHTEVAVTAGVAYTITEGAAGTTDLANYTTASGEGCSGTLAHFGDTAACTITNTLKAAPKLTVIKHVVNNNGGTRNAGNFTLTVTGASPSPASFAGSEAGTAITLQPGPYAVNEAAVSGYSTTKSAGCAGSFAHFGDTATCTVTNDDTPAPPPPAGVPEIDLAITKADSPDPVSVGALLTYTLTVTNKKGDTANNVVVTDSLPSAVTFVSVSSTKGSCSGTNPVSCNIGTVAFNELVSIMIVVRPSNPGTITNTAVVTGREHEHDPSDNTASAATLVQGAFVPPSVCYALTVTPRTLTVGRTTTVRIRVREAGKPVKSVRVVVTGRGVAKRANTNASGLARFVITGRSPGILQVRVPAHATCRTQRIGVLGVFTPPVTG
jgi:uncharacterized repeat protein (TIGR01451 family)